MPMTASTKLTPSIVPLIMASMLLSYFKSAWTLSAVTLPSPGTISRAIKMAAGNEMREATIIWPTALGTVFDSVDAYRTRIAPEIVAMISTMIINISDRLIRSNHARSTSGDSTTPRNMVVPAPRPTTPLTPIVFCKAQESPLTAARNTPQCHSKAEIAEKTMISGKI